MSIICLPDHSYQPDGTPQSIVLTQALHGTTFAATVPALEKCVHCQDGTVTGEVLQSFEVAVAQALIHRTSLRGGFAFRFCRKAIGMSLARFCGRIGISAGRLRRDEELDRTVEQGYWDLLSLMVRQAYQAAGDRPDVQVRG